MESRPIEFDGLVVEGPGGVRLLAIPASVLPVLRDAHVIQYAHDGHVARMVVARHARFARVTQATDVIQEQAAQAYDPEPSGSAPTREYGAPTLPLLGAGRPSPTSPPAVDEPREDPADVPIRVRRGGEWATAHVTRAQYEEYVAQGRISQEAPAEGTDQQ